MCLDVISGPDGGGTRRRSSRRSAAGGPSGAVAPVARTGPERPARRGALRPHGGATEPRLLPPGPPPRGGMVATRRSLADGRDTYYLLDLSRCRELLVEAGSSLHPGLAARGAGRGTARARVLFLCTGNSARSQMAEALAARMSDGAIRAASAGSHPKPLHPLAVSVLRMRGSTSPAGSPSTCAASAGSASTRSSRSVIACARSAPSSPALPSSSTGACPIPPASPARRRRAAAFTRTADELTTRVRFLVEAIDAQAGRRGRRERGPEPRGRAPRVGPHRLHRVRRPADAHRPAPRAVRERRGWLEAHDFEDAIAACNLLPGPASTQLAIYCAWRLRGAARRARRRRWPSSSPG